MPSTRFILFAVIVSALVVVVHRYLWVRFVRDVRLPRPWRWALTAVLVAGGVTFGYLFGARKLEPDQARPFAFAFFVWLGFLGTCLPLMLAIDIPLWLRRLVVKGQARWRRASNAGSGSTIPAAPESLPSTPQSEPAASARKETSEPHAESAAEPPTIVAPDRRLFMRRMVGGVVGVGSAGLVGMGMHRALGDVELKRFSVKLERLPPALEGFRIVQLTDVHIGVLLRSRFLDGVIETVNKERPDLVVITGDLVDGSPAQIGEHVARLRNIRSRYGTYFVTGNHEYYSGAERWLRFLHGLGIESLENRRVTVGDRTPGGASIDLAGITDKTAARFIEAHAQDLKAALSGRDPDRELVLLAHRPDPIEQAAAMGVGLQLSGHTHGGQLFPITLIGELVHRYNLGLHRHGDTQIYVSPGTGFWGPPVRTMTTSEVTSVNLVAG